MVIPAQQSSPVTALSMLMMKWTSLSSITSYFPSFVASRNSVLIIGGDMNAQIGKNINNKFSLYSSSNRNGEHLSDFTLENRLTCLNTKFQKRKGKLLTYNNNTKAQIDYILINKKWKIARWIVRHVPFLRVSSNHQIVIAKIWLSLWKNAAWTTTTIHRFNNTNSNKYTLTLRNKFEALQISETYFEWLMRTSSMPT